MRDPLRVQSRKGRGDLPQTAQHPHRRRTAQRTRIIDGQCHGHSGTITFEQRQIDGQYPGMGHHAGQFVLASQGCDRCRHARAALEDLERPQASIPCVAHLPDLRDAAAAQTLKQREMSEGSGVRHIRVHRPTVQGSWWLRDPTAHRSLRCRSAPATAATLDTVPPPYR